MTNLRDLYSARRKAKKHAIEDFLSAATGLAMTYDPEVAAAVLRM